MKSNTVKRKQNNRNEPRLKNRFIAFSIVLFLLILVVGGMAFIFSMRQIVRESKDIELPQMLYIERLRLESSVEAKIFMVQKMANSPVIIRHFANPDDPALRELAMEEIDSFREFFYEGYEISWVNDIDRLVFSTEFDEPYWLDADNPTHYWYYRTLYETEGYSFNVNYNPETNAFKMWVNAPVLQDGDKPVGMVAVALEVTEFINRFYQDIPDGVEIYLFNALGEITGAKDVDTILSNMNIMDELGELDIDVVAEAMALSPEETKAITIPQGTLAVGTVPSLRWYTAAFKPNSISDYNTPMTVLFLLMIAIISLIFVVFNLFNARSVKSIGEAMESLKNARSEAEAANKAKSSFLSTMSHEIRTPMNAILGIAEIRLHGETADQGEREALERIYTSGDLLLSIINDILDLSKIESGKMELIIEKYEVASLISDVAQLNIMRIGSKQLEFDLNINENVPAYILGDELRIKQVLNNLLSNAFKYTAKGKVTLSFTAEEIENNDENIALVVSVRDTGYGMTKDQIDALFEEYSRFNQEVNRTTEGTGLGMSITNKLVSLMDGDISVESEPGKGSVFTVRLPQGKAGDELLGTEASENLKLFRTRSRAHMKRVQISREPMPYGSILIVDDVESNIYVAKGLLLPYELKIDTVNSGFEAIEKIKNGRVYDIIFMDHMMPKMDGVEATKIIRDMGYEHYIVALTASAVAGQASIFLENGFDDYITKPIDIRQLNNVLNKLIRDKQTPETIDEARKQIEEKSENPSNNDLSQGIDRQLVEAFLRDANNALVVLGELSEANDYSDEEDINTYIITSHGIKNALANIGEVDLSDVALGLEAAAREKRFDIIEHKTLPFLDSLRQCVETFAPREKVFIEKADEDKALLHEKLLVIKEACEDYNMNIAMGALNQLRGTTWSRATEESLETIAKHLLHGDFEAAITTVNHLQN